MAPRFLFIPLTLLLLATSALSNWNWQNPAPQGNTINALAVGNGIGVAVGSRGTINRSTDGIAWTTVETGVQANLLDVAWGAGRFVAVGEGGTMLMSSDGVQWTFRTFAGDPYWNPLIISSVNFGNGRFVAVAYSTLGEQTCTILTSSDGNTWVRHPMPIVLGRVKFAGDRFFSVGQKFYTSADGISWNLVWNQSLYFNTIAYANGVYTAVGQAWRTATSTNGTNWTVNSSGTFSEMNGICTGPAGFVAVGTDGRAITSADGATWTARSLPTNFELNSVQVLNGAYLAVGELGGVLRSTDTITWTAVTSDQMRPSLVSIAHGAGRRVAMSFNGRTLVRDDGGSWVAGAGDAPDHMTSLCFGSGVFVAVGRQSLIMTSSDGVNWTPRANSGNGTGLHLARVRYLGDRFFALGDGDLIMTSPDGITWTSSQISGVSKLRSVVLGNGRYVAVGGNGLSEIVTSTDGVSWSFASAPVDSELYDVAYGAGRFVAAGSYGTVITSPDGLTWTAAASGTFNSLGSICRGTRRFVAVGEAATIVSSLDGLHWELGDSGTDKSLAEVIAVGSEFVGVGDRGNILSTPDADAPALSIPDVVVASPGAAVSFTVTTDAPAVSVENMPEWLSLNTATGVFSGVAPSVNSATLLTVTAAGPLARTRGSFELIVPKTYSAWSQTHFGVPDRPANEDADGDGAPNNFEYAFATNPRILTPITSLASFEFIQGGAPTFTFPRDASVVDYRFEIQASSDLSSWAAVARSASNGRVVSIDPAFSVDEIGQGLVRSVRAVMNPPVGPRLFMRLRLLTP